MDNHNTKSKIIMKSKLSNSGIDVTVKDVEKYMNRYNEVMKGKNGEKAKENLVTFNIIVVIIFFVFILWIKIYLAWNRNVIAYLKDNLH